MARKTIIGAAALAAMMIMQLTPAENRIEERSRHPTGLYLSGFDLGYIRDILRVHESLLRDLDGADSIGSIKTLIKNNCPIEKKVAFIRLDSDSGTAWKMMQGGRTGHPAPITLWSREIVESAEAWCTFILCRGAEYIAERQRIKSDEALPEQVMASIDKYENDIYISEPEFNDLRNIAFAYMARNSDKVAALAQQQPELYARIDAFRTDFDAERLELADTALARLDQRHKFILKLADREVDQLTLVYDARHAIDLMSQDVGLLKTIIADYADDIK